MTLRRAQGPGEAQGPGAEVRLRRVVAGILLVLVVAAGLVVHFTLPDGDATDIAGDALYVAAVYAFVVVLAPRWSSLVVGSLVLVWCVGVELFQLTGMPLAWGARFAPIMLVLGTVFDARDLAVYATAAVALSVIDLALRRAVARRAG